MSRDYRSKCKGRNTRRAAAVSTVRAPRLNTVKPVPRNQLVAGAVVWAHLPFRDGTGEKVRPAVVVSAATHEVVLLSTTTSPNRLRYPGRYVEVTDLEAAGIRHASGVALRLTTVPRIDLVDIVGGLSPGDAERVFTSLGDSGGEACGERVQAA